MVRRTKHAFHDVGLTAQLDEGVDLPDDIPESLDQQFVNMRLNSNTHLDQYNQPKYKQPQREDTGDAYSPGSPYRSGTYGQLGRPEPLINKIPKEQWPSILGIGAARREPVPMIPEERDIAQNTVDEGMRGIFDTFRHACPPPADTQYLVDDMGVSGPEFFRLSMYNIPSTDKLRKATQLPLSMYLCPFARAEVPLADFSSYDGETMPPRCRRCRAYMNPSMRFTNGGARFVCNLCLFENTTPAPYFQPTTPDNKRIDWDERPELAFGTYEFIVAKAPGSTSEMDENEDQPNDVTGLGSGQGYSSDGLESSTRNPESVYGKAGKPFRHVFCCEVSRDGVQKGILETFSIAVRTALTYLPAEHSVAILVFDSKVTYIRPGPQNRPELLVMSPGSTAVPQNIFMNPVTQREDIEAILNILPDVYGTSQDRGSCLGDAVRSIEDAPDFAAGGRITVIATSLASVGDSKLVPRDRAMAGLGTDIEPAMHSHLFNATSKFYIDLGVKFASNGWACDVLAVPTTSFVDLGNLVMLPRKSGGRMLYYPRFSAERDSRHIVADILAIATSPVQARHVQLKIRCSTGLQVSSSTTDPEAVNWGFMDSESNFVSTASYDTSLDPSLDQYFQAAVLYTTKTGEKRIRVCNQLAGTSAKSKAVYNYLDIDVVMLTVARQTLLKIGDTTLLDLRNAVIEKLMEVFSSVRELVGMGAPVTQLLVPKNLRLMPMYMLALTKSIALGSSSYSSDARVASAAYLATTNPQTMSLALYPRIYTIESSSQDDTGIKSRLARYNDLLGSVDPVLVFNGQQFYLWLSTSVLPSTLQSMFGTMDLPAISPWVDEIARDFEGADELGTELRNLIAELMTQEAARVGRSWLPLQVVRQGLDGAEYQLKQLMVEDSLGGADTPSYIRLMAKIHESSKLQQKNSWF